MVMKEVMNEAGRLKGASTLVQKLQKDIKYIPDLSEEMLDDVFYKVIDQAVVSNENHIHRIKKDLLQIIMLVKDVRISKLTTRVKQKKYL